MSLNPTVFTENGRSLPGPDHNVVEIERFRKITYPGSPSHRPPHLKHPGRESGAMVIPFDEILKYKERNDAVKGLQKRTGLGSHDALSVIETIHLKDIGDGGKRWSRRFLWLGLSFAAAGLIWFL